MLFHRINALSLPAIILGSSLLTGCQLIAQAPNTPSVSYTQQEQQQAEQEARALMARYKLWQEDSSPMLQAYRGQKSNYSEWDNLTLRFEEQQFRDRQKFYQEALSIPKAALKRSTSVSLDVLQYELEQDIEAYQYRLYQYPLNPMFGLHTQVPSFMMNIHQIQTIKDARAYIDRIWGLRQLFDDLLVQVRQREAAGIIPPKFVMESVISTAEGLLQGYPITNSDDEHVLWQDFNDKIAYLDIYPESQQVLSSDLKRALQRGFAPAYRNLIRHYKTVLVDASKDTGFGQFEDGKEFYQFAVRQSTTTATDASSLHELGKQRIADIHLQIEALLPQLGFETLEQLFDHTRTGANLFYKDGDQAIEETKVYIRNINQELGKLFYDIPNMPMEVRAVEPYREASSPVAFYQPPSNDGSRPGRYYMNLSKLDELPKFQFEALTYHEALPGHHLQTIYAKNSKSIPEFRRHIQFTAYSEGWGLYAESLAQELGGYQDPWNDYGRLLMELWRAMRLVLDTGLHYYQWDIEQALEYRMSNTPFSEKDSLDAIQRYIVMPGQATSYMVGKLKLEELRDLAQSELGYRFDSAKFHTFILQLGPLPLAILEQEVKDWIKGQ